jgi:hypothetical protein
VASRPLYLEPTEHRRLPWSCRPARTVLRRDKQPFVTAAGEFDSYTISPNGRVVVGTTFRPGEVDGARVPVGSVVGFSGAAHTPTVLYRPLLGAARGRMAYRNDLPLWIGNSGREVLIDCYQQRVANGAKAVVRVVLLHDGQVSYLPWLAATGNETTAFPGLLAIMAMPPPYRSPAH